MKAIVIRMKLLIGPAAETDIFALVLSRQRSGFVWTGFAQPNSGTDVNIMISGNTIVPIGSI